MAEMPSLRCRRAPRLWHRVTVLHERRNGPRVGLRLCDRRGRARHDSAAEELEKDHEELNIQPSSAETDAAI